MEEKEDRSNIFQTVSYHTTYAEPELVTESPIIAFTGRSNAGKSSLLSGLCNHKNLARAARTPGKTRNLNLFRGHLDNREFFLCDLPGFGFANLPAPERKRLAQMIESFFLNNQGTILSLILCDSARWPGEEEAAIEQILLEKDQSVQWVFTRWDRTNQKEKAAARKRWKEMGLSKEALAVSSTKGTGLNELRKRIRNRLLQHFAEHDPAPES
jgi:GTP-binding protein